MMKVTYTALFAATALAASSLVFAADGPPKFAAADANGDGAVDATEFEAAKIQLEFGEVDKDGDGKLSEEEYTAALDEECV